MTPATPAATANSGNTDNSGVDDNIGVDDNNNSKYGNSYNHNAGSSSVSISRH